MSKDSLKYTLVNLGKTRHSFQWCWYAMTTDCEDRKYAEDWPTRDNGWTYAGGFESEEKAQEYARRQGWTDDPAKM